jgi:outer membrane protein assembly factor BamB
MFFGLNIADGTTVLKQEVQGRIKTSPAVAHGRLFIATDEKLVLSFRSAMR